MSNYPSQLVSTLQLRLPGAGRDALLSELANAMQEFCTETGAYRCEVQRNLVAGRARYDLNAIGALSSCITHIVRLEVDSVPYAPISPDSVTRSDMSAWYNKFSVDETPGIITLYPEPKTSKPKAIRASLVLRPGMGTIDLPLSLSERYHEALIDGTLERMYAHVSKPYTNDNKALYHHRRFRAAITRTRRVIRGGETQSSPAWRFPSIAPSGPKRGARSYG